MPLSTLIRVRDELKESGLSSLDEESSGKAKEVR